MEKEAEKLKKEAMKIRKIKHNIAKDEEQDIEATL